ncbi:MAG: SDR family NAD(P)-dependent oxidoreductase [Bacteroidales bacterium]|nr:SDR family NAD(P)-dependent oxidoreductase [Bacteroidales bacterium]
MAEKIAVITGATGGIGKEICKYLADNGYTIYASYRSESKKDELLSAINSHKREKFHFYKLDLTSLSSAESFCNCIKESLNGQCISLLLNNAGMIADKFTITPDGYEKSMQVNYISPRRITENLLEHIDGKIINTISCTIHTANHNRALRSAKGGFTPSDKPQPQGLFKRLIRYSDSKLMLALYTLSLADRFNKRNTSAGTPKIEIYGADPGIVDTGIITMHSWYDPLANIVFRPFIKRPAGGAAQIINAIKYDNSPLKMDDASSPLLFIRDKIKRFPRGITKKYGRIPEF